MRKTDETRDAEGLDPSENLQAFQEKHGLLPANAVANMLGFPTLQALQKARLRGTLPIALIQIPHRRGWFASRSDVIRYTTELKLQMARPEEPAASV